ncbi:MAG: fatty acid desaturase [Pseudomonadota bacterium]
MLESATDAGRTTEDLSNTSGLHVVKRFCSRDNWKSVLALATDWAIIVLAIWVSVALDNWLAYLLSIWFIAGRMMALGEVLGHDAVHYNLFSKRHANRWFDFLYFLPVFNTFEYYREEHVIHHRDCLQGHDPTVLEYRRWGLDREDLNIFYVWWIRPLLFFDTWYFIRSITEDLIKDSKYRFKILTFWGLVVAVFAFFNGLDILFFYWIVPFLWLKPALEFWSETSDHYYVACGDTRSCGGWFHRLFLNPHNDGYHAVHHRFAGIPWHQLPAAHDVLITEPKERKLYGFLETYREIRDNYRRTPVVGGD